MSNCINVYAAYAKDTNLRINSSSGGMFSLLANHILEENGVIYGVRMDDDCYGASYERITDINDLHLLRGSKYLQAKIGNTFKDVKNDLEAKLIVLFTGTGCYINGLKTFLKKDYENLICVDVVCHGTPSPKLWRKYVEYREMQNQSKMIYASFRNKEKHGWDGFEMKEIDETYKEVWISRHIDPYFSMFVKNICLRPSCFSCTAKYYKLSDITIADFWGIDTVAPEMNDDMGVSLVITRTEKGQCFFDLVSGELIRKTVSYEEGVRNNKSEYQSYEMPSERYSFFKDMNNSRFEELIHKYVDEPILKIYTRKLKQIIKKMFGIRGGSEHTLTHEDYGLLLKFVKRCANYEDNTKIV